MISDGNILRLLYFLFFILSTWSSIPCPSFNDTLANFENKNKWIFWMFSAASQIAEEKSLKDIFKKLEAKHLNFAKLYFL